MAQLEMGERRPSRKLLTRLGTAMGLSADDQQRLQVAYGFSPAGDTPGQIAAFLRADKRLSGDQAERLANLVREAYERALNADTMRGPQAADDGNQP